ncbi:MAG: hypothetical protein ACLFTQ_00740 [Candidatus Aenigmatarchaeota archaeon]
MTEEGDESDEKKREELRRLLEEVEGEVDFSAEEEEKAISLTSREYETFREEEEKHQKKSLYERFCNYAGKIAEIEPGEERKEKMQKAIDFAHLQITPEEAYSLAIFSGIGLIIVAFLLLMLGISGIVFTLFLVILSLATIYLLVQLPESQARLFRVKASNEIVMAVIYMVIYMRFTPNLEGAIRFAAQHLKGPLSLDFKKILWDIEMRNYPSAKEALVDYLDKWEDNKAFVEAVQTIQNSMEQSTERRKSMLDEAVNAMMSGSEGKLKEYANSLKLPIMIIHMMGIMLPIMVLVMFPIILLMLEDTVNPLFLVIGYNIILPLILYFTGKRTLEYRPLGFSAPDLSMHPDYKGTGKISILGHEIKIWPVSLILSLSIIATGIWLLMTFGVDPQSRLYTSLVITWGIALGPISYFFLDSKQKLKIRERINSLEDEFHEALFSLGNRLSLGKPIEKAMEDAVKKNEELEISNLFQGAVQNMKEGGMTLKGSLFDEKFGAIWKYPSKLIKSVLQVVVRATDKSAEIASVTTISISRYLKRMKALEKEMKDSLSSATTSMQFLGSFLGPLVAGVSVTMAGIMIEIFMSLDTEFQKLMVEGDMPQGVGMAEGLMMGGWGSTGEMISIYVIQIVVGIYVIETAYLLSMLSSGIENGPGDKIARRNTAARIIFIGVLVFTFSLLLTYTIFGTMLQTLIGGGMA